MISDVKSITREALIYAFGNVFEWCYLRSRYAWDTIPDHCICTALYRNHWCAKHGDLTEHGLACRRAGERTEKFNVKS